jgi:hypothetical protein
VHPQGRGDGLIQRYCGPVANLDGIMSLETDCPLLMLVSGQSLKMRKVMLYHEEHVKEIAVLRAQAMKSLGGVSTGVGFLGSPAWALGGAAVLGILEGMLSSAIRKQAIETLQAVESKSEALARNGVLFALSKVAGAIAPHPEAWSATEITEQAIDLGGVEWGPRKEILQRYNKTKHDIVNNKLHVSFQTRK